MNQTSKCIKSHCGIIKLKFFRRWELFKSFLGLALYSIISWFFMSQQTSNDVKIDIFDKIPKSFYAYQDILSEPFNAFSSTKSSWKQCSRCLAIHIARPLKNGGALPIFHANPSYFDDSEIQSSDFQWVDLA